MLGRYLHYKGNEYELLSIATHADTGERMVVYRGAYEYGQVWTNSYDSFFSTVEINGIAVERFAPVVEGCYLPCL